MDHEFLQEIEAAFTNVGRDTIWERDVGGRLIKFTPISLPAQEKVNEVIANHELGNNIVLESKRITLSHSIVGIDAIDLLKYRDAGPIFQITTREGRPAKVALDKYIYEKMKTWGGQYIDDLFSVYADLNESQEKHNLKNIKFENLKDPELELLELEERVADLREQLGKPKLIESTETDKQIESEEDTETPEQSDKDVVGFDPFRVVEPDEEPLGIDAPIDPAPIDAEAAELLNRVASRSATIAQVESQSGLTSTSNPHALGVPQDEVIETRNSISPVPPVIDAVVKQSVNPRFVGRR